MPHKLLVIDDDPDIRKQMKWAFAQELEISLAEDRQTALMALKQACPAVVTLDLGLPPDEHGVTEGFQTLQDILKADAQVKVIVITGQDDREHALQAIGQGAHDFFCKPIQLDALKITIQRALHVYQLEAEYRARQSETPQEGFEGMLGTCHAMQEVFATIRRVAPSDAPVVISGESGTGKELVARAIHRQSPRADGPFVAINCGAIPDNLLESELFGHEKGAFTGAHAQKKGRIELAQGGTLFLDEIGELSLPLQVKLLRFLQEHQIERIGGHATISVDTRVLAATHVSLEQAMREGQFREDLFFRLRVVDIVLPPLRQREDDIVPLAETMLQRYTNESKQHITGFSQPALMALSSHTWPGNVRELENRIRRAVIMATTSQLTPEDLGLSLPDDAAKGPTLQEARAELETELIRQALKRNHGNITHTAAELELSRPTLRELIKKYGLRS